MSSGMPELGSKISLISKADIRYEGRLFTVDPQECTIALASVRSFGTEDRETQYPVAPQNQVYDYILFRGSDIKDIRVVNNVPSLPNDPAIMQLSVPPSLGQGGGGVVGPYQQPQFSHPVVGPAQYPVYHPMGAMRPAPMAKQPSELSGPPPGLPAQLPPQQVKDQGSMLEMISGASRSETPLGLQRKSPTVEQGTQVGGPNQQQIQQQMQQQQTGGKGPQQQHQQPAKGQHNRNNQQPQQQRPRSQNRSVFQNLNQNMNQQNQQQHHQQPNQQQQQHHQNQNQQHQPQHNNQMQHSNQQMQHTNQQMQLTNQQMQHNNQMQHSNQQLHNNQGPNGPNGMRQNNQNNNQGWIRGGRGGRGGRGNPRGNFGGRGGNRTKNTLKFDNDYDFEQANTEFEELRSQLAKVKILDGSEPAPKPEVEAEKKEDSGNETGAGEPEPEDDDSANCYDKTKSFFDNISCEAVERSKGRSQRTDWRTERKLNSETFGVAMARRGGYRGRGYWGGGGQGGGGWGGGQGGGWGRGGWRGPSNRGSQHRPQQHRNNNRQQQPQPVVAGV